MRFLTSSAVLTTLIALAAAAKANAAQLTQAAGITLTQDGLALLARELTRQAADIKDAALDDVSGSESGIEFQVEGVKHSIKFGSFDIKVEGQGLRVRAELKDLRLDVDKLKLKKRVLGTTLRTTCSRTVIKLGHSRPVVAKARVRLAVKDQMFSSQVDQSGVDVDRDDYEVQGPQRCTGDIGVGYLIRFIVRGILDQAASRIVAAAKARLGVAGKDIAAVFTRFSKRSFSSLSPGSDRTLAVDLFPTKVRLKDERLQLILGMSHPGIAKPLRGSITDIDVSGIGALQLNPELIEFLSSAVLAGGPFVQQLDTAKEAALREVFGLNAASAIWPDLLRFQGEGPEVLGAKLHLTNPPRLSVIDDVWVFDVSQLRLDMSREPAVNYFHLLADLKLPVELSLVDRAIEIKAGGDPSFNISGHWPQGSDPQPDFFEADVASALILSALDAAGLNQKLTRIKLPEWKLGGRSIRMIGLQNAGDSIRLDFDAL